jgi:hypothetical protein
MWSDWVTTFYHVSKEDESNQDSVKTELLWLRLRARARLPNRDKHMILHDANQTIHFREYDISTLYDLVYN